MNYTNSTLKTIIILASFITCNMLSLQAMNEEELLLVLNNQKMPHKEISPTSVAQGPYILQHESFDPEDYSKALYLPETQLILRNELKLIGKKYNVLYDARELLQDKVTTLQLARNTLRHNCSNVTLKTLRAWLAGIEFIVIDKTGNQENTDDICWQAAKREVTEQLQSYQPVLDKCDKLLEFYYTWKKTLIGQEKLIPLRTFFEESLPSISHTEAQELLFKLQLCPLQIIQLNDDSSDSDDFATA